MKLIIKDFEIENSVRAEPVNKGKYKYEYFSKYICINNKNKKIVARNKQIGRASCRERV